MPGGDRTGPMGQGPRTGRGMGLCAGNTAPGFATAMGRGMRGRGRGWRYWFCATGLTGWQRRAMDWPEAGGTPFGDQAETADSQQELQSLQREAHNIGTMLQQLLRQLERLQGKQSAK